MKKQYEKRNLASEVSGWWFYGRRDFILRFLKGTKRTKRILDIGCGGGTTLLKIKEMGFSRVLGIDVSKEAIKCCKKRGLSEVKLMNCKKTSFTSNTFDIIISSDVLEHIKDDLAVLNEWNRILKKTGRVIIFVPAFKFLWDYHDTINNHFRRYDKKMLYDLAEKSRFKVIKFSYWNFFMFFPHYVLVKLKRILNIKKDNLYKYPHFINSVLTKIISLENFVMLNGLSLPVGISALIILKKV